MSKECIHFFGPLCISINLTNGGDVSITQDFSRRLHPTTYSEKFAGLLDEIAYLDNITCSCDRIRSAVEVLLILKR